MTNQREPSGPSDADRDPAASQADTAADNDPHKVEKLTKAGRDLDPNVDGE